MRRLLVIPAAGRGTRLGADGPKFLAPVLGAPMVTHVLARLSEYAGVRALVIAPGDAERARVQLAGRELHLLEQATPTGMVDALLTARPLAIASRPTRVWIAWCDQVALSADTAATLDRADRAYPFAAAILPTVRTSHPYIHFERDATDRLAAVRQRREGDDMPERGTADAGLFSLSYEAFVTLLPAFARDAKPGALTGERNFLPFLPWAAHAHAVHTFTVQAHEAAGVNTRDDLARVERLLASSRSPRPVT